MKTITRIALNGELKSIDLVYLEDGRVLEVPHFSLKVVKPLNCAGYARRVAEYTFGKKFPRKIESPEGERFPDAWEYRNIYKTIPLKNPTQKQIRSDYQCGNLREGDLVGILNPQSTHRERVSSGEISYTHIATFLGFDHKSSLFAEQFGKTSKVITLNKILQRGNLPKEIITNM